MGGYIGSKAVSLSTTSADVTGDADIGGDLTVDTNTLHVDSTNNRVGIGTSSPSANLEIDAGSATGTHLEITTTGSGHNFDMVDSSSTARIRNVDGGLRIGADHNDEAADSYIRFDVDGTEKMRINSGNVGINEDNPESLLHITSNSTSNPSMFQLECTNDNASTGPDVYLYRNSPSPAANDYIGSTHFVGNNSADETITYATHYAKIIDATDGAEESQQEFYIRKAGTLRQVFSLRPNEVVVNQDGQDVNFRVESDASGSTFVVDAGEEFVGLHTSTPASLDGYGERVRIASNSDNLGGSLVLSANNGGRTSNPAENDIVFYDTDTAVVNNQSCGSLRWYGRDGSGPGEGFKAGIRGHARSNGALYLEFYAASSSTNYQKTATLSTSALLPGTDNLMDLGSSSARWDDVFATNGTIQTSDERLKQQVASLTTDEMNAAKAISALFKTYKWNDKVAEKGDNARIHSGVIAQQVKSAMENNNLDPMKYAFFCWNEYYEIEVSGEDIANPYMETFEVGDPDIPEGATYVDRYSIRYGELMSFIHAATEQRLASIETEQTAIKARLDALEAN